MALFAGILTTYYGPKAAGSGVAEVMGYLNGVHYPGIMSLRTLFTKVIGVTLAVLSKLSVGKEGPLCHIGAICGNFVPHLPFIDLKFAQNDF